MYTLLKLPYKYDALEPYMDQETMILHHQKHHQGYIDKLNEVLVDYDSLQELTVEDLLLNFKEKVPVKIKDKVKFFAGGVANHDLFWQILAKKNAGSFIGKLKLAVDNEFGSFSDFKKIFETKAMTLFGSGWVWLTVDKEKRLEIISSQNHDSPLIEGKMPLLLIDMWEHAFYLKHQNRKADYLAAFWQVINFDKVEEIYQQAVE